MRVRLDGTDYQVGEEWRGPITSLVKTLSTICQTEIFGGVRGAPILHHCGKRKIAVIKEIRSATGLNLKDAKAISDRAPVKLPVMDAATASAFVMAVNNQGGHATMPAISAVDRMAELGKRAEAETPEAEELFSVYLCLQEQLFKLLKVGEMNGVFRDKIESRLSG